MKEAIALILTREVRERVRDRTFLISLAVTLAIVLAVVLLPALMDTDDTARIGVAGTEQETYTAALVEAAPAFDLDVEVEALPDREAAEAAVADDDLDVAVVVGEAVLANDGISDPSVMLVQSVAERVETTAALHEAGIPPEQAASILAPEPLPVRAPDGEDAGQGFGLAFVVVIILYGQLFGYGMMLGSGIVEEKQSRVVEILLSTVRPSQLLAGKLLGIGVVGLLQLALLVAVGLGGVMITGVVELPDGAYSAIVAGVLWFLLGYAFYSGLFAVAGAIVSRQEDLQSTMTPITLLVLGGFFLSFTALSAPTGTLAQAASYVPAFAPLVMPVRIAVGAASTFEIVAAVALTLGASALLLPLAARIYSGAVLRTGGTLKLREAWRGLSS